MLNDLGKAKAFFFYNKGSLRLDYLNFAAR